MSPTSVRHGFRSGAETPNSASGLDVGAGEVPPPNPGTALDNVLSARNPLLQISAPAELNTVSGEKIRSTSGKEHSTRRSLVNASPVSSTVETWAVDANSIQGPGGPSPQHNLFDDKDVSEQATSKLPQASIGSSDFSIGCQEGPCLWPVREAESRLIKYFFNVLVTWVSEQIRRHKYCGSPIPKVLPP